MVILLSDRKSSVERQITEILSRYGADYISDKTVSSGKGKFTIISEYRPTEINIKNGIAVIIDDTDRFKNQSFKDGLIGICEDKNRKALQIFKNSHIPVISCGMGAKNTVTLSSLEDSSVLLAIQRSLTDFFGNIIDPAEFKIKLTKPYLPFAVMTSTVILLLMGITPECF